MKLMRVIVVASAFALICACSGTTTGPTQAGDASATGQTAQAATATRIPDPCKLLTQAEASEAIGAKLDAGELKRFGAITRCSFYNKQDRDQELFLDVHNETATVPDSVLFEASTHSPDAKPVREIGEQALWYHSDDRFGGTSLDILKGGRFVHVILPRTIKTMTPPVEKAAKLIASRM